MKRAPKPKGFVVKGVVKRDAGLPQLVKTLSRPFHDKPAAEAFLKLLRGQADFKASYTDAYVTDA